MISTMALCKLGNGIIQMRGRFGGVYFKHDRMGQHIQKMPRVVRYQRMGVQASNVGNFSDCSMIWKEVLTLAMLAAWALFALIHWWITKDDRKIKITGWNWFVHYNMKRLAEGKDPILWPPID